MGLELAAILIVISGLVVYERGTMLSNANCMLISEAGERAAGFGVLMAICATPWFIIGYAFAQIS